MHDHGDFYDLFRQFWWVIFPIFGMITALFHMNLRHDQYNKALDMIKSYVDQGKEPPPELLAMLRDPNFGALNRRQPNWIPVFLFTFLAAGFAFYAFDNSHPGFPHAAPFLIVALVMAAMAAGSLANVLTAMRRNENPPR